MISVIIPTCNRNLLLSRCLDCLAANKQQLDSFFYEVIVSDDGDKNQARDLISKKYSWVKWIEGPKKGPAANRNHAAKYAKGDWLLFVDDDCLPDRNWIRTYLLAIEYERSLIFEGYTDADRPKERFDEESPININGGNLWACNFCIQRSFFYEIGCFDENFPFAAMEDIDLRLRILKHHQIVFLKSAIVVHPWRKINSFSSLYKHLYSNYIFRKKHVDNILSYRFSRVKIFIGFIIFSTKELVIFSFKGYSVYLEKLILNFLLIFI